MPKPACPVTALAEPSSQGSSVVRPQKPSTAPTVWLHFFAPSIGTPPAVIPLDRSRLARGHPTLTGNHPRWAKEPKSLPGALPADGWCEKGSIARSERHPDSLPLTSEVRRRANPTERPTRKGVALPHV